MSVYINHSTNDVSTNAGAKVTSGGNTVITTIDAATESASGIVELATSAEVQTGTDTGRVPSVSSLRGGLLVSGTAIATTSGTSHDFTVIPSWVKRITGALVGTSTNAASEYLIQIGDSGGIETTGYAGGTAVVNGTPAVGVSANNTGYIVGSSAGAATIYDCTFTLTLINPATNTWSIHGTGFRNEGTIHGVMFSGSKSLSATLDRVRLTTTGGNTFDAGLFNIVYE